MKNFLIIVLILAVLFGLLFLYYLFQKSVAERGLEETSIEKEEITEENSDENLIGMPNAASLKCEQEGGVLEKFSFKEGEDNYCIFDDGSRCWEWDFYRGNCNKGELIIETIEEGEGNIAEKGDSVEVHYTGTLLDGTKFDSSVDRGIPFTFVLGGGMVISGWEQGVLGMRIGEKRKLTLAPILAYGDREISTIPANSTLIFEVELLGIDSN